MNIMKWIMQLLQLVPIVVTGIENIHKDAVSGADKKTLAMESLGLAQSAAEDVLPEQKATIDAARQTVSDAIDGTVAVMNAAKNAGNPPAPATATIPDHIAKASPISGHPDTAGTAGS